MPQHPVLKKFLPGRKPEEIHDFENWRVYFVRLMLLVSVIALPVGFLISLPTYISEHLYGMICIHIALTLLMAFMLWMGDKVPQVRMFFVVIYGITLTFLAILGPYYGRPAWLIMCVVTAAFLFGTRAAIVTVILNVVILITLYFGAPPYLPAWQIPHSDPLAKWLMFCGNLTLLSIISTLPAAFLLNRMTALLKQEKTLNRQLAQESEDLQAINLQLEKAISDRTRTEAENKRLQTELVQAQKMDAMGTLAGGIAHDFNNILSAIIGYGQLIQADASQSVRSRQNIEKLLRAGDRARSLVQQILTFSRKVETSVKPLDLADSITDTLKMMRALIPSNIKLQKSLPGPCMVMSSPTFIHQILMNLCTNAIHAMGADGGTLDISLAHVHPVAAEAAILKLTPGHYARISVRDTGCGIAPHIMDRIFEPYFTTKDMGTGTGLGLSVVHGIVQSHGGTLTCRSNPGQGATFDIYIPQIESAAVSGENAPENEFPTGTETVLYIDDEAMLTDTSGQILETLGYHVVTTNSSAEGLKLFSENPARFDAVITDMTMPQLTGDKLARKILDIRPDIPIIICTGYSDHISGHGAIQMGIRDFLMKPYTMDQLAHTLRRALDETPYPDRLSISS